MAERDWAKLGWRRVAAREWRFATTETAAVVDNYGDSWHSAITKVQWGTFSLPGIRTEHQDHDSESSALTAASEALGLLEDDDG